MGVHPIGDVVFLENVVDRTSRSCVYPEWVWEGMIRTG